ncbi:hypothetical protein L873DRAFT_926776 [Choiromyces venosus 120613-1]|uniref:Uncharacterized protein n=1 Tax=Choiromyces venosus 120613-1 TaxID=1336337 RepID=A0A3N4JZK9_9PEZI|nr:hypothetical protein L873DRAFT_926776 [Choiromyces venosus 120613-1]
MSLVLIYNTRVTTLESIMMMLLSIPLAIAALLGITVVNTFPGKCGENLGIDKLRVGCGAFYDGFFSVGCCGPESSPLTFVCQYLFCEQYTRISR